MKAIGAPFSRAGITGCDLAQDLYRLAQASCVRWAASRNWSSGAVSSTCDWQDVDQSGIGL